MLDLLPGTVRIGRACNTDPDAVPAGLPGGPVAGTASFGIIVVEGRTTSCHANETVDLHRPVSVGSAYTLETTVPRLWSWAPAGTAFGDSRWQN